ncbi:hypothetical protein CAY60_013010 [Shouchella clausii]|jgi:hypothetical protein|uniref:Histone deacetylase n=3 Tax=Shouchella TaxID=2893057 RepID=Q5WJ95_SHOC1|nr:MULTISPECIES: hypothetical protein [Shouchella]MCM3311753.1 hypothetical protein [Psychrobacillus sp. MER TA 17]ALA51795.1 hypothetical protein DB29_00967 [Shouchella clausii]MBU3232170.1 hypothetical protein [Shouchella clausii]MBU3264460.1 hypothetical protein [Shouchella clausii]MBU3508661.1 hypothetical protein [Shouchella clausii]
MDNATYVWYASYGSNMNRERFLCYIRGGQPEGAEIEEVGCSDPAHPIKETAHRLPFPLYFAQNSTRWQKKGVAFIGLTPLAGAYTYSRKYLITKEQFEDVVKQENNGLAFSIDIDDLKQRGRKAVLPSWYGTVLYAGEEEGFPIFTFTAKWKKEVPFHAPSFEYLRMIVKGLYVYVGLPQREIVTYLRDKPGVAGNITEEELWNLVNSMT